MKVKHGLEMAINMVEKAINGVRGTRRPRTIVSWEEIGLARTKLFDPASQRTRQMAFTPFTQAASALGKVSLGGGSINVPSLVEDGVAQLACATLANFENRVKITVHRGNPRKQATLGLVCGLPAIGANRGRLIRRF